MTRKILLIGSLALFLAFLAPDIAGADGLVPCGGEGQPQCTICHLFLMINNIIKFVMFVLIPPLAAFMLVVGGIILFFAGVSPERLSQAKSIIFSVVIGLAIILCAWVIVNTILVYSNIADAESGRAILEWWKISCE